MKKTINKLKHMNITYKLFAITSSLLIGSSLLIYYILYFSLPSYYEKYKEENLNTIVDELKEYSQTASESNLVTYLHSLSLNKNLMITAFDDDDSLIYGKPMLQKDGNISFRERKNHNVYEVNTIVTSSKTNKSYFINIVMPLQPINEASIVLKKLMPSIILLSLLISFIGAYIYSIYIAKPLMDIIDIEREQENKRKQFIATISHELKTPITIISGQLEGMIYNIGKYKDRDTYLKNTYKSTMELKQLVDEMMEISKADMIEQTLSFSKFDLNELLKSLIKRQSFLLEEKSLSLNTCLNGSNLIYADKDKLTRAINNIINNAIKYSPSNETIFIKTKSKGNETTLIIKNTGVTIPQKDLNNIFNPFFRVEQSRNRKTGGSGLGLYIVSQILKAHNYSFEINNDTNSVVFKIILK